MTQSSPQAGVLQRMKMQNSNMSTDSSPKPDGVLGKVSV